MNFVNVLNGNHNNFCDGFNFVFQQGNDTHTIENIKLKLDFKITNQIAISVKKNSQLDFPKLHSPN